MTAPIEPTDPQLGGLLDGFRRELEALEDLRDRIGRLRGRGEAEQGRVVVDVTQTGALAAVTIDPRAMRLGSERLAAAIMEAAARAERAAEREASELVAPFAAGLLTGGEDAAGGGRAGGGRRR